MSRLAFSGQRFNLRLNPGEEFSVAEDRTLLISELAGWPHAAIPAGGDGEPLVGRRIGPYTITRQLPGGGMAWVYEATSEKWPRPLVLKLPAGGRLASAEAKQRFKREVLAVKALSHASIVGVLDDGESEGVPFMVMNFVEGQTLREWAEAEQPNLEERLSKFGELCQGIAAVHREKKMHRDLKPDNVMVDKHGTVRLLDFGLARSLEESSGLTQTGTALGTPNCMAPEQTGTGALGTQTDVYALGAILHWLLCGHYPLNLRDLTNEEMFLAICHQPPTLPGSVNQNVPPALDALVKRCLQKDPAYRPVDAGELLTRFQQALDESRASGTAWLKTSLPPGGGAPAGRTPSSSADAGNQESAGGAVSLKSPFYLERGTDRQFIEALVRSESVVLIQGPRQIGKTSLLARGLHAVRQSGRKVVLVDFQAINSDVLSCLKSLYLHLGDALADQLALQASLEETWDDKRAANTNLERFLTRKVLAGLNQPLIWAMDEVDRLFPQPYCSELFGMFRSWHNARSLNPDGPWSRLTLGLAHATEAKLFITDLNQSPFNIGVRLVLEDFTLENLADLNRRHREPLAGPADLERLHALVGGHPFLVRSAFAYLVRESHGLDRLEASALAQAGPFAEHLGQAGNFVSRDESLRASVSAILRGTGCPALEDYYRLRSAGLLAGDSPRAARLRCALYERFFRQLLAQN